MKDLKMCSFRMKPDLFISFKDFCTRNQTTIKDTLTKLIEVVLEAETTEAREGSEG